MTIHAVGARPAPSSSSSPSLEPSPEPGIGIGLGAVTAVTAGLLAAAVPVAEQPMRFGLMVAAVAIFAALIADPVAVGCAAGLAWLVVNGFLVDRFGELSWHGPADVYRAVMLIVAGVLGLFAARVRRRRDA
jgi:MFS family permease